MKLTNKRIMIIKTITIFVSLFIFSYIYNIFPNFLTAIIFPVNESLFEHLKMIFNAEIIVSIIIYLVLKKKKHKINNYFIALLLSTVFNIILFFLTYLPIYNRFGHNLIMTMTLYFITLSLSQYLFYLISLKPHKKIYNYFSLIIILIISIILAYFTYNPLYTKFFFDPIHEIYGISKY